MIAKISGSGERISTYEIADTQMAAGSTLGAPKAVTIVKATGAIEKVYSTDVGAELIGTILINHWDERSGVLLTKLPGDFLIHPDHQEHVFTLSNGIAVREDVFVLSGEPKGDKVDPPAVYYTVELHNTTGETLAISTYGSAQLRGNTAQDVRASYSQRHKAIVAWNQSNPDAVRLFGCSREPASYETTFDNGKSSATAFPGPLCDATPTKPGDPIGILHLRTRLRPGARASFYFLVSFSPEGRRAAQATYASCPSASDAFKRTRAYYEKVLDRSVLATPDPEVNRGVLWAKANALRVQILAKTGWCFVNDPTRSNNSVARDTAWFAFGSDYMTPEFSHESLLWYATHLERRGMVVEYYDIRNGKSEDYKLNINDDTPLLIMALWHHYCAVGDRAFLRKVYPHALRAARYILSQRNEQGLVWCTATGTADWGICGWRNVIEGYRLSGAVTEVNSECHRALFTIARMARELKKHDHAREFERHADELQKAINEHLFDKKTGLYYLNIDLEGNPRTDVTADLVFPVMFGVANHDVSANIISRLSTQSFWSEGGIHTVPRNDLNYGPTHGYGLLGGVWLNMTFWYAFAASRFNPEFMAHALSTSFAHYSRDPGRNNTVPGQFSEWLHGETLVNQGMMLSPWFPPKYIWAAIEGAAGLDVLTGRPRVQPRLAADWKWLAVRNVPLCGRHATWFAVRTPSLTVYADYPFDQSDPYEAFEEDLSSRVHVSAAAAVAVALRGGSRTAILVGNTAEHAVAVTVHFEIPLNGSSFNARSFNSLREEWIDGYRFTARQLRDGFPVQIDAKGFCLVELREES